MNDETQQKIREQEEQIKQLKQAVIKLERMVKQISQQYTRVYHSGRKNSGDIMQLSALVRTIQKRES